MVTFKQRVIIDEQRTHSIKTINVISNIVRKYLKSIEITYMYMYMYFLKKNKMVIGYKAYLYSFRPTSVPCLLTLLTFIRY